jgi:flagellar biosynthesis/type III secretory pathway protein FliH
MTLQEAKDQVLKKTSLSDWEDRLCDFMYEAGKKEGAEIRHDAEHGIYTQGHADGYHQASNEAERLRNALEKIAYMRRGIRTYGETLILDAVLKIADNTLKPPTV